MIITFQSAVEVTDLQGTIASATAVWQEFIGDTDGSELLPWNATIQVTRDSKGILIGILTAEINDSPGTTG